MKFDKLSLVVAASVLVAACGGGGSAGTSPFGGGSGANTGTGTSTGGSVSSNSSGAVVLSLSRTTVSASQPATVTAVVKDASGAPVEGAIVSFALSGDSAAIGQLSQATAITGSNGEASTTLLPAQGVSSGAAYVTASADVGSSKLTTKVAFSLNASSVTLSSVSLSPSSINGYGSTAIAIAVSAADSSNPVQIEVSSTCADGGKAEISPSTVKMTSTTTSVTYKDKACGATDRINVRIAGTSQQKSADLVVAAPATTGIQFVKVQVEGQTDGSTLCLSGTGCPSSGIVTFKVVDEAGAGKANQSVSFELDAGSTGFADLSATSGVTASDGTVAVSVSSRQTPIPLRVLAKVTGTSYQTISNKLTIAGGLPVAGNGQETNGLSLAATKYALNANLDGDSSDLTVRLSDRWGSPAREGTAVSFVTSGGTVVPASCTTDDQGACKVKLIVTNPRPANGQVAVVAYAKAQERFTDTNNNGVRDGSEVYEDVPVGVCLDRNLNDDCDLGEFIVGVSTAPDSGNGAWDNGSAYARQTNKFVFSRTDLAPRLFQVSGGSCTNIEVDAAYLTVNLGAGATGSDSIQFCLRDGNTAADASGGNPIESESELAASTDMADVTVSVDNSPTPATANEPTMHSYVVKNSAVIPTTGGRATLTITLKSGRKFTYDSWINVQR